MFRRELKFFFAGFMILDEASGVSMMSTSAMHQRLLLRLQISRQWKKQQIRAEPMVSTREIQERLSIGTSAMMSRLHDHLRVRKRCARWILHPLTDEQQWGIVGLSGASFMLREFNGGRSRLNWEVLTFDETWIYGDDPETKMQSAVWLFLDESPPPTTKQITQHTQ